MTQASVPELLRNPQHLPALVVRGHLTACYLAAVPRRILLMEQQVWSILHARQSTLRPRVAVLPPHGAFQGHVAHPIEWSMELNPKGSTGACTPIGIAAFLVHTFTAHTLEAVA